MSKPHMNKIQESVKFFCRICDHEFEVANNYNSHKKMHDKEEEETVNRNEQTPTKNTESYVLPQDDDFKEVEKLWNTWRWLQEKRIHL